MGSLCLARINPPSHSPGYPEDPSFLRNGELATTDSGPFVSSAVILQILGPITAKTALFAVILLKIDRLTAVIAAQVRLVRQISTDLPQGEGKVKASVAQNKQDKQNEQNKKKG